jgi:hypothetical protein
MALAQPNDQATFILEGRTNYPVEIFHREERMMWTATLQLDPAHVIPVKILGRFSRDAYFSRFAPLQVQNMPRQPLPDQSWVRVRNLLAGICGSDLHLVFADGDFRIAPAALPNHTHTYPGREVVGEMCAACTPETASR